MTKQNIDFSAPLSLEDALDTASIQRLASVVGAEEATIRRWLCEEGELLVCDPEAEARRPWLNRTADLVELG